MPTSRRSRAKAVTSWRRASPKRAAPRAAWSEEYRAWLRPWGFKLEDIGSEVHILYGDGDTLCPLAYGEELARRIPGATRHVLPGEGHVSAHLRYDLAFDLLLK
jgi:pimeloyl-ACP methyl ester carboxylesterase